MPEKGGRHSEDAKRKISKSMKGNRNAQGKRSERTKKKMRDARKGFKPTKEHVKNMTIALNKPEVIEKNRQRVIEQWRNGSFDKDIKRRSERTRRFWQEGVFDGVFQSPTKPEKEIMRSLKEMEIEYIFQFRPEGYSKIYDFYIPEMNLLIEYDSKYWHKNAQERDAEKTNYAKTNGYDLLRVNEEELNNFESVIKERKI